jgi:hypothetical protein
MRSSIAPADDLARCADRRPCIGRYPGAPRRPRGPGTRRRAPSTSKQGINP